MKLIILLFMFTISCPLLADRLGPSTSAFEKAPPLPQTYSGSVENCQQFSKLHFEDEINKHLKYKSDAYILHSQIDLNLDGICEIIAYQQYTCGTGGCGLSIFKDTEQGFKEIEFDNFDFRGGVTYLEPKNGWLQMSTYSQSGWCCQTSTFVSFIDGKYRLIRKDNFKATELESHSDYIGTDYFYDEDRAHAK